jgi:hypothetical protein
VRITYIADPNADDAQTGVLCCVHIAH